MGVIVRGGLTALSTKIIELMMIFLIGEFRHPISAGGADFVKLIGMKKIRLTGNLTAVMM
jgi:hypothetical protein